MKGQATIEFLGSIILFLLVLIGSLTIISGKIPEFQNDIDQSSKNMEMYSATERILGSPGYHNNGSGGTDWQNHINATQEFGLASEYLVVDKDKLDAIATTGNNKFNYSQFRETSDLNNQYYFNFTWFPVVETSRTFTRTNSPSFLEEPASPLYTSAENEVHYGTFRIRNTDYRFLVTAHNGVYNTTRIHERLPMSDWDFRGASIKGVGDNVILEGVNFTIVKFQNRERKPGASVVLKHRLKGFGANPRDVDQPKTKLNRFASLEASNTDVEPLRIEVLAW